MEKMFKKSVWVPFLFLFLLCLQSTVFGQVDKAGMANAVKEAEAAGVPSKTLNHLLAIGYENQIDVSAMGEFVRVLTQARREGIPLEPFMAKVDEGITKRIPPHAIQQALVRKMGDYRFTQSAVKETLQKQGGDVRLPDEYFIRLAESLSCGISRQDFQTFLKEASSSPLPVMAMTVEVVATLKQNELAPEMAHRIGVAGLQQNYFTPERRDFARVLVIAKQKKVPDQKILTVALETIQKKGTVQEMAPRLGITPGDLSHGPSMSGNRGAGGKGTGGEGRGPGGHGGSGPGSSGEGSGSGGHGGAGGESGSGSGGHGGGGPR